MDVANLYMLATVCEAERRKESVMYCVQTIRALAECPREVDLAQVWDARVRSREQLWGVLRDLRSRHNPYATRVLPRLSKKIQAKFWYIFWYDAVVQTSARPRSTPASSSSTPRSPPTSSVDSGGSGPRERKTLHGS